MFSFKLSPATFLFTVFLFKLVEQLNLFCKLVNTKRKCDENYNNKIRKAGSSGYVIG